MSFKLFVAAFLVLFAFIFTLHPTSSESRQAARLERRLVRMVGYTIVAASTVDRILEDKREFKKILVLADGTAFTMDDPLLLDPLVLSDVIIFAKPIPKELREKFQDLPEKLHYSWKVAVDGDVYAATPR